MSVPHTFSLIAGIMGAEIGVVTPSMSITNVTSANEGDSITFSVSVSNFPDGVQTVSWSISHVSTEPEDFADTSGSFFINVASGVGSQNFSVLVATDQVLDDNEQFRVNLSCTTTEGDTVTRQSSLITVGDVEPVATPIPAGTITGREPADGVVAFVWTEIITDGPELVVASLDLEILHGAGTGPSGRQFIIRPLRQAADGGTWWNSSGVSSPLQQPSAATPPTIYAGVPGVTPVACKFDFSINDGASYVEGDWQAIGVVGDSATVRCAARMRLSTTYEVVQQLMKVRCWGRANGYEDTLMVEFDILAEASGRNTEGGFIPQSTDTANTGE